MSISDKIKEFVTGEKAGESKEISKFAAENCALCQKPGSEKKWSGNFWHKKCYRRMRGMAKGMV